MEQIEIQTAANKLSMPKKNHVTKSMNGDLWMHLEPPFIEDQISFAKENGVKHFAFTCHPSDMVEFFPSFDGVQVDSLYIGSFGGIVNAQTLKTITSLRSFKTHFESLPSAVDFSKFKNLTELEITFNKNILGLSSLLNLENLKLWKYKPATKNLLAFQEFKKLKSLMLVQSVIDSLDGASGLEQLVKLDISRPKGFSHFCKERKVNAWSNLKELDLSFCKQLDFNTIPFLKSLVRLSIDNCGKIDSFCSIIRNLPNLKEFIFVNTDSIDGSISCLKNHRTLEKVTITQKKHYDMQQKEINEYFNRR